MIKKMFSCMASPCEVLMETHDPILFDTYFQKIKTEAERLEAQYSRYKNDNIIYQINTSNGKTIELDTETHSLFQFADQCFEMSEGLFDVTSGVLRKVWNFKNFKKFPESKDIQQSLGFVGWQKVKLTSNTICLQPGMEVDLGGIVKEYAVDKCLSLLAPDAPATLINFGGDLSVNKARLEGSWSVAIEEAFKNKIRGSQLHLRGGALATSGDTYRHFDHKGKRYSHILNPKTGYPVHNNIASITVFSQNCTMAGMLATISHLQEDPDAFLKAQGTPYWIVHHTQ